MNQQARPQAYIPSPSERVRDQVGLYEATDGREGGTLEGRPVVILTTTGALSGAVRKNPVIRIEHEGSFAAVASAAGAPRDPAWYRNLVANPIAQLQDGATHMSVRAREITGEEKQRWWQIAETFWPHFPEYRAKTDRDIPIMVLEPVTSSSELSSE
jgi:deazaflavin-dependent oxidoreductase (nitroreductase family)